MDVRSVVAGVDRMLDFMGYLPVISHVTGKVRLLCGVAIAVSSLALQFFYSLTSQCLGDPVQLNSRKFHDLSKGFAYGCLHIVRGSVEAFSGSIGLVPLLGYDYAIDGLFNHRVFFPIINETEWLHRPVFNQSVASGCFEWVQGTLDSLRGQNSEVVEKSPCPSPLYPCG